MAEHDFGIEPAGASPGAAVETPLDPRIKRFLESLELEDEERSAVIDSFEPLQRVLERAGSLSDTPPNIIRMTVWI